MYFFLDFLIFICNISIEICAYVVLSWYAAPPPSVFIFKPVPLATYYSFVFFISNILYLGSFYLCWYPSRLVAGPPPCTPPHPLLFFNRFPLLPTLLFFFINIIIYLISFYLYCCPYRFVPYILLSYSFLVYITRDPPTHFYFFHRLPLLPTLLPFVHKHHFLGFIFSFFFFQTIHRDLCLCTSFLIFSFIFAIYPLRLVPMCFFSLLLVLLLLLLLLLL